MGFSFLGSMEVEPTPTEPRRNGRTPDLIKADRPGVNP
jgi:hypothetical protein